MSFESMAINLIILIPTILFAIFEEKHPGALWTSVWTFLALSTTGGILLIDRLDVPAASYWRFLPAILIFLAFVLSIAGHFLGPSITKFFGVTHFAASLLLATLVFQYTLDQGYFFVSFFLTFIIVLLAKNISR